MKIILVKRTVVEIRRRTGHYGCQNNSAAAMCTLDCGHEVHRKWSKRPLLGSKIGCGYCR